MQRQQPTQIEAWTRGLGEAVRQTVTSLQNWGDLSVKDLWVAAAGEVL